MKKALSILLVALMALSVIPFTVFAVEKTIVGTEIFNENTTIEFGDTWIVPINTKLVIERGINFTINNGGVLIVHGTVENKGNFIINSGGTLEAKAGGQIKHEVRLPVGEEGKYTVSRYKIEEVPVLGDELYDASEIYHQDDYYYEPLMVLGGEDVASVWAYHNEPFYFRVELENPAYDIAKLDIAANGIPLTYRVGRFVGTKIVTNSLDIRYGRTDGTPIYGEHLRKSIRIALPGSVEEGYQVVAYYNGQNFTEEVEVLYGSSVTLTVMLDPSYSRSKYTLTVGGRKVEPNEDGFFYINNITDGLADAGEYEIFVMGVMANEMLDTFSGIFAFLKQIVDVFMDIFRTFMDMFSGGEDPILP